jgi:hypothetical protein
VLVYGLILWFIYLGFAEGVFMVVLVFFMFAFVLQYILVVPIYGWFGVCLILF